MENEENYIKEVAEGEEVVGEETAGEEESEG